MSYTWNLEKILESQTLDELIDSLYHAQEVVLNLFNENPFDSIDKLKKFHVEDLALSVIRNRLSNYLSNHMNTDLSETKWFLLCQEIESKSISFHQGLSSFSNQAIKYKQQILQYIEDPIFHQYKKSYLDLFLTEKHQLDPEIKKYAATFTQLDDSFYSLFTLLFDTELKVSDALDSKGKKHPIKNYSDYQKYLKHKDRKLRENTFLNWTETIHGLRETFARLMYYNFLESNIDAKNHKFNKGHYESVLFNDEITDTLIPFIYKKVAGWSNLSRKFSIISRKIIKHNYSLKKVEPWDLYMPMNNHEENYSIEEAKEIVLEGLKILGLDYQEQLKNNFNNDSIDWLPKANKRSGAYCIGSCYGLDNKYVLMNYNNKFDDVLTIAHELGHAIHAIEFCKTQTHHADCSIFIAEIPSTLNEILINYYFLEKYKKEGNLKKQLEIYDSLISSFINTTSSQITFSSWEYDVNKQISDNVALTADMAESLYFEKQKQFLGIKKLKPNPLQKKSLTKILTVPHFYCGNFYVYKYAVGMVVSVYLAQQFTESKDESIKTKFYDFLASGSSRTNLDTIKLLGVSLEDDEVWDKAHKALRLWISEYSKVANKLLNRKCQTN